MKLLLSRGLRKGYAIASEWFYIFSLLPVFFIGLIYFIKVIETKKAILAFCEQQKQLKKKSFDQNDDWDAKRWFSHLVLLKITLIRSFHKKIKRTAFSSSFLVHAQQ